MAEKRSKKASNIVVWGVLGLLVLALGGFGVGQFGGSLSSVAQVGDREITVDDYANALQGEQRRLSQGGQQPLTFQQMQMFGVDRQVMERLLAGAALEVEAARMGLSVGDAEVAQRIRANPAFGGIAGGFDRQGYGLALRSAGLTEARFERQIRDEAARELLQAAVVGGVEVPDAYALTLGGWLAETRDATLAEITETDLPGGAVAPTPEQLAEFFAADAAAFETPEIRRITYAWITPDAIVGDMVIDEDRLRARYDELASELQQPARVLAERLVFADDAAAVAARAAIDAGETTFDALVQSRGLTLDDVDQGEIAAADVDTAVAEALFSMIEPGIAGPVATGLGPALYRVNAVLDATEVPLDDVRDDLTAELAADAARRQIDALREDIDDSLAGGATLEELATETDMTLGTVAYSGDVSGGIAGYDTFRAAAEAAMPGDFPELASLSDGGLFALRLDGIDPPATPPLDAVRDEVEAAWRAADTARRLAAMAEDLAARFTDGQSLADAGLRSETLAGITRDGALENVPASLVDRLFGLAPGDVVSVAGDDGRAFVVRLDGITPIDPAEAVTADLLLAIRAQIGQELSGDVFEAYGRAVQADIGYSINQGAVQAVQSQLFGLGR